MKNKCIGYIPYTPCENTQAFIQEKLRAVGCNEIIAQPACYDDKSLDACINGLKEGDTLITWRLDRTVPKYRNKVTWLTDILEKNIRVVALADHLELQKTSHHPGWRLCNYFKAARAQVHHKHHNCGRYHRLNHEQTASIYQAITSKQSTISLQARKYSVSRTTLYAAIKRYAEENQHE